MRLTSQFSGNYFGMGLSAWTQPITQCKSKIWALIEPSGRNGESCQMSIIINVIEKQKRNRKTKTKKPVNHNGIGGSVKTVVIKPKALP